MQNTVSFIHTGDLHLGSLFTNIPADEVNGTTVMNAGYDTLCDIVDEAISRRVDFVLFAGDVFDSPKTMIRAQARFESEMVRLRDAGITVYIIYGNHDPVTDHPGIYRWPDNVVEFGYQAFERNEHEGKNGTCAIYGRSFGYKAEASNFVTSLARDIRDKNAVGLLHTDLGRENATSYAPCSVEDLRAAGMDYWALGHTHNGGTVAEDPLIVYCTSPQALDINETGKHGFHVVELTEGDVTAYTFVSAGRMSFVQCIGDISQCEDVGEVIDVAGRAIQEVASQDNRNAVVRLTLQGIRKFDSAFWNSLVENEMTESLQSKCAQIGRSLGVKIWLDGTLIDKTQAYIGLDALASNNSFIAQMKSQADKIDLSLLLEDPEIRGALDALGAHIDDYQEVSAESFAMAARDLVSGGRSL